MTRRLPVGLLLLVMVILGLILISDSPAQEKASARVKWEYKIVKKVVTPSPKKEPGVVPPLGEKPMPAFTLSEADLAALGEAGWELVAVTGGQPYEQVIPSPTGKTTKVAATSDSVYYFKRPK